MDDSYHSRRLQVLTFLLSSAYRPFPGREQVFVFFCGSPPFQVPMLLRIWSMYHLLALYLFSEF